MNKSYRQGQFNFKIGNLWGNFSPCNSSYYLCHKTLGVIASCAGDEFPEYPAQQWDGFDYNVIRDLFHFGRLRQGTFARFVEMGGDVNFLADLLVG